MQYQALRKLAASKLMLFASITKLLTVLLVLTHIWRDIAYNGAIRNQDGSLLRHLSDTETILKVLPLSCFAARPVIAMFLTYRNARSGRELKRTGYSILRVSVIVQAVLSAVALSFTWYLIRELSMLRIVLEILVMFLISIGSASVLKTAGQVADNGLSRRNVTYFLPILLILSFVIKIGNMIALLVESAAHARASVLPEVKQFRFGFKVTFIDVVEVGMLAAGLLSSLLLILLCFRGRKALSSHSADTHSFSAQ